MGKRNRSSSDQLDGQTGNNQSDGRQFTISVAVGASCIENAQSLELGTILAGQISRACTIFNVDEIIVIDDTQHKDSTHISTAAAHFARILQFMETPQYLKKALIPIHPDLRYAGALPPLDAPHHLRSTEWCPYREGYVKHSHPDGNKGSFIDVGLDMDAHIDQAIQQGMRVTLNMGDSAKTKSIDGQEVYVAALSSPTDPRDKNGLYWGYITRIAPTLESLFNDCPFEGGYDLKIGTSERGEKTGCCELKFPAFKHALVVFGGPQGLEYCLQNDPWRSEHEEPSTLFDRYLNTCHKQGSRTIRTEEAILDSLAFLQPALGN